ncbi:tetratricopeptide repeat protein [Desulfovibrio sp. OttesenSCG-928-A18]|nr:tetratricopeptide repeat protein [Desulfovibrio sp. OttesenSCG-928-A18]
MSAKPEQSASLMGSLQSEVATEASPLMLFLIRHARTIAIVFVLCIVAIIAWWIYSWQADKTRASDIMKLGGMISISDPASRLEKLEAFAPQAPDSVQKAVWFAILDAATELKDQERIYTAWSHIAGFDKSVKATATLGMANALAEQEKYAQAIEVLEQSLPGLAKDDAANIRIRIAYLAELTGDYQKVLSCADAIVANPGELTNVNYWVQKKADVSRKLGKEQPLHPAATSDKAAPAAATSEAAPASPEQGATAPSAAAPASASGTEAPATAP